MTDKLKAKIGRDAVEWIQKNLIRECDGMFREPCAEESYTAGAASLLPIIEQMRVALERIEESKGFTRLADCCIDKSCHINTDSGSCSFQTGVYYANGDRAGEAKEALAAYERFVEEK